MSRLRRWRPFDPTKPAPAYHLTSNPKATPEETAALQEQATVGHYKILVALCRALQRADFSRVDEMPGAIDLRASKKGTVILFEAKTLTGSNESARVRGGLAQLLEYRFFWGSPRDTLCIVGNAPIRKERMRFLRALEIDFIWVDPNGDLTASGDPLTPALAELLL